MNQQAIVGTKASTTAGATVYKILFIIGICHLLNDAIQSVVPAMFPILEKSMGLSYTQLGVIAFSLSMVSSVMQPLIGLFTDRKPKPFALPIGLTFTFIGVLGLAFAPSFGWIVLTVIFIGIGSASFIRKVPELPIWQPEHAGGLPNRFIRSAEIPDKRWPRLSQRSFLFRSAKRGQYGFLLLLH